MSATLPSDQTTRAPEELNLLRDWEEKDLRPRFGLATALSIAVHIVVGLLMLLAPGEWFETKLSQPREVARVERKVTPLVAPRFELTQKDPNKGPIKQELNLDDLNASLQQRRSPKTYIPPQAAAAPPQTTPRQVEAPPPLQLDAPDTRELAQLGGPQLPPPEIRPPDPPKKNPFENPGQVAGVRRGAEDGRIPAMQRQSVEELMRESIRESAGSSGQMVTDLPAQVNPLDPQQPIGSSLELLSDPQGVDFRPYLRRVLSIVRRNWFAVIPESARFGRRGRTAIQFSISRDGKVPKLVISAPSGTEALDRAAVAGISASNPFPPLPAEFKGDVIRLQFVFSYNMR